MLYKDNKSFQTALLSACQPGSLILTSGGRLARHLKHRYRKSQMAVGKTGWASPEVFSLNAWIRKAWDMTWPSRHPLSKVSCFALWKEACSSVPPPEPFLPDSSLFQALDETYAVLARHGLPTEGPPSSASPLVAWRSKIMKTFETLTNNLNGFHPALLPVHLAQAVQEGLVSLPETIVLAAFETPAPIEEALFDSMGTVCRLSRIDLPAGSPEKTKRITMSNRKQEVGWLTGQLVVDAQTIPLNRIGVVAPDAEAYIPHIGKSFREIMGDSLGESWSAYNIAVGTSLSERSLVQSGLLPLRFWVEGQPRTVLLSLILSTYYGRWSTDRDHVARVDQLWRRHGTDAGLHSLLGVISGQSPELFSLLNGGSPTLGEALNSFAGKTSRTGAEWVETVESFWNMFGFPVIADEIDTGAWNHLKTLLHRIREDLGKTRMSLADFTGLLNHFLSEEMVHVSGNEEAGLQVLGIIESRGLDFDKLYVLGLAAGSLPRPVRPLPLLDPQERQSVLGATTESQYHFAQRAFHHLLACAPDVTLIRPEEESAEPLAPSPFWTLASGEETHPTVDIWNAPDAVSARTAWLQQANKGLAHPTNFPPVDSAVNGYTLPKTVSVSALSIAFRCPFRFFAEKVLGLLPLDELITGIPPLERGNLLHRTLAIFTRRCRDQGLVGERDWAAMETLLKTCSDEVLSAAGETPNTQKGGVDQHSWTVERLRWVGGEEGTQGLLTAWLRLEGQRLDEGWRWLCEEASFEGLSHPDWPFSVAGRVDRVDYHVDNGYALWDYKTGGIPTRKDVLEHLIDPQILAYVHAAKEGRIPEISGGKANKGHISGGYIRLKAASTVVLSEFMKEEEDLDIVLQDWKEAVAGIGYRLASGQFGAEPGHVSNGVREEKACRYCPYRPLCGRMGSRETTS
ncbi:MAG: PD-(D/E)XK nuclease family protein [Deltaproteobacteria bacterium]|nr:PD-(D/E)XK nuclease family protein [Deltaproteobacteria bacterium]